MAFLTSTPLPETRTVDESVEPGMMGAAAPKLLPEIKNYAASESVRATVRDEVLPILYAARYGRRPLSDEWDAIRRMEMLQHDDGQRYRGRSNAYLPLHARNVATQVSALSTGLFPSDEYLDVADQLDLNSEAAKAVKAYVQWEFESNANVRAKIKPFLRQLANYGNAAVKYWYRKDYKRSGRVRQNNSVAALSQLFGSQGATPYFSSYCSEGFTVSPRNILNMYLYPVTAESVDHCTFIAEDINISRGEIEALRRAGRWVNVEEALNAQKDPTQLFEEIEQLNTASHMSSYQNMATGAQFGDLRGCTECWTYLVLPRDAYLPDETPGEPIPCRVVLMGNTPVVVTRNPFFHQKAPYRVARTNVEPGLVYGYGLGRLGRFFQYLANDFANQTNDAGNYTLNPVNKVNPAYAHGTLRPLSPGVTWYFTDVNEGQKFERPDAGILQSGLAFVQFYMGASADYSGVPPVLQGVKGGKTATATQILQHNAQQPLADIVEDLELDVMIPLMEGCWYLGQQYRNADVMAQVGGGQVKVSPEQLGQIEPSFRWLASSQAVNSQQRSQQALALLGQLMPIAQYLQQLGYQFDPVPLIEKVYTDGMGFRGFDRIIKQVGPPMGVAPGMGPPPPGGPPGAPLPPQDGGRARSAVEQAGGQPGFAAPGEANDFMQVRGNADELAANAGANGGGGGDFGY